MQWASRQVALPLAATHQPVASQSATYQRPFNGMRLISALRQNITRAVQLRPSDGLIKKETAFSSTGSGAPRRPERSLAQEKTRSSVFLPVKRAQHERAGRVELNLQFAIVMDCAAAKVDDLISDYRTVQVASTIQLKRRVGRVQQ